MQWRRCITYRRIEAMVGLIVGNTLCGRDLEVALRDRPAPS